MREQGRKTPLDIRPPAPSDYQWYLGTFYRLYGSRSFGERIGYIQYSEFLAYFSIYPPLDDVQSDVEILHSFDVKFIKQQNERIELERKRAKHGRSRSKSSNHN